MFNKAEDLEGGEGIVLEIVPVPCRKWLESSDHNYVTIMDYRQLPYGDHDYAGSINNLKKLHENGDHTYAKLDWKDEGGGLESIKAKPFQTFRLENETIECYSFPHWEEDQNMDDKIGMGQTLKASSSPRNDFEQFFVLESLEPSEAAEQYDCQQKLEFESDLSVRETPNVHTAGMDENFDVHPKLSENNTMCRSDKSCSMSMFTYNQEAKCCETNAGEKCEVVTDGTLVTTRMKKRKDKETGVLLDRHALFTDGQTCWNPPLFLRNNHPIPSLEMPSQKFRQFHSNLLKSLVRESVIRTMRSRVQSTFEIDCLKLGVSLVDIELFRSHEYDLTLINDTWFNSTKIHKLPIDEKKQILKIRPSLRQIVSKLNSGLESVTSAVVDDALRNPKVHIDWLFVSAQMLIRGCRNISPDGCQRLWKNAFCPGLSLPCHWSQQEFSRLKALTMKPGKRNFVKIAKEMGPKFSPFLCMKMFVKYIRPLIEEENDTVAEAKDEELFSVWKQDEVQHDFETCMEMFNGSFRSTALWLSHAYGVDISEKFIIQQNEKYKIGPFSMHEDALLLVVDEIIQEHNLTLYSLADFLPWRPEGAWNHRIDAIRFPHRTNSGGKNEWNEAEDRLLLKLVKKYRKDWVKLEKYFVNPRRSSKALHSRYVLLGYTLRKCTLEEFHGRHRDVLHTRFYYMRKTLTFLEELDMTRSGSRVTYPDTVLVHKLFQRCNHSFQQNSICLRPSKSSWKLFPQNEHIRNLLLQIPRFYFRASIEKMHKFFNAAGIPPALPR